MEVNQSSNAANPLMSQTLPNATTALVLGIVSIAMCWCYGVIGIIAGIVGIILGSKAVALYNQSPGVYSEASYKNANAGKICAIIGLSLSILYFICLLAILCFIPAGSNGFNMMEAIRQIQDSAIN